MRSVSVRSPFLEVIPMVITLRLVLLFLAFVSFVLAAIGVQSRVNTIALGLALWVLSLLVAG